MNNVSGTEHDVQDRGFDAYRDSYESELEHAVSFVGQDPAVYASAKADVLVELAEDQLGESRNLALLDVGCGIGVTDAYLHSRVRSLSGVDVSAGMIERARRANPSVEYESYDGRRLPYEDERFDLVFAICVVHHVPPASWNGFFGELARVTRRNGLVAIFEHNPFNPATRLIVSRCSFDADAVLLNQWTCRNLLETSGLEIVATRNILFVPWRNRPIVRIERLLRAVPLGAQYVVAGRRS